MEEKPFEDRVVPKMEIDWSRSLWWWYPITRAIHPAMRITALLLSAVGLLLMYLGPMFANWLFSPRFVEDFKLQYIRTLANIRLAPIETGQSVVFEAIGLRELAFLTFSLLWLTVVLGVFGGVLSRRAAIELGQRTIAPWGETVQLVGSRLLSYLWVTGMHLVALFGLLLLPYLLGVIARLGPVAHVSGFLLLILFPLVFAIGRLVISMFICYPLAVTAISCERNGDAFEGFSRSNNYFFQRPVVVVLCALALWRASVGLVYANRLLVVAGWLALDARCVLGRSRPEQLASCIQLRPAQRTGLQAIAPTIRWVVYGAAVDLVVHRGLLVQLLLERYSFGLLDLPTYHRQCRFRCHRFPSRSATRNHYLNYPQPRSLKAVYFLGTSLILVGGSALHGACPRGSHD